ncbi:ornithine decarboxylase-like [Dermacentor variabilis]|uniref:ornithine decarboxylase-like n=1 Tax=Dermacentor variabilis TaxID=34621 RepID=UPI003F5B87EC
MNELATRLGSLAPREFAKEIISKNANDGVENPFFVVDIDDLFYKVELLRKHFPRVKPFYAVKCNDNPVVLEVLGALDVGFDCASIAEIEAIISLRVDPSRIIYAHTQKHVSYLHRAWTLGVDLMTFDSADELYKIKGHYPRARLVLRLKVQNKKAWFRLGDKFGCSEGEAVELLHLAKSLDLTVVGVCFHVGGGNEDARAFATAIAAARRTFDAGRHIGFDITLLDIGGGYPREKGCPPLFLEVSLAIVRTIRPLSGRMRNEMINPQDSTSSTPEADEALLTDIVNACLEKHFPESYGVTVISEPGGFVVSSALSIYTKIIGKRMSDGSDATSPSVCMYYINESMYKSFIMSFYNEDVIHPEPLKEVAGPMQPSMIWGITCDGSDRIKSACGLPDMDVGDWLCFENMGAYSITITSPFNGFPNADIHYRASKFVQERLRRKQIVSFLDTA